MYTLYLSLTHTQIHTCIPTYTHTHVYTHWHTHTQFLRKTYLCCYSRAPVFPLPYTIFLSHTHTRTCCIRKCLHESIGTRALSCAPAKGALEHTQWQTHMHSTHTPQRHTTSHALSVYVYFCVYGCVYGCVYYGVYLLYTLFIFDEKVIGFDTKLSDLIRVTHDSNTSNRMTVYH